MEESRSNRRYVLVTPARNEAATIGKTIDSVVRQTLPPEEWVIVSDGSTDATEQIAGDAARRHPWIVLKTRPAKDRHCFASVVEATEFGIAALSCSDYAYLGLLDADVRFRPDYYEETIRRFEADPSLGMAGGMVVDVGEPKGRIPRNRRDIPGAVQFFRRSCYESLGGLVAIPEGGWDTVTCAQARMNGFRTELFPDLVVDHLKPRNVSRGGALRRKWQMGVRDFAVGYRAAFETVKCLARLGERPWVAGALARWLGFTMALLRGTPRRVPEDLVEFLRAEQGRRIRETLFGRAALSEHSND